MVEIDTLISYAEKQKENALWKADNCRKHPILALGFSPKIHESYAEMCQSLIQYLQELKQYREKYPPSNNDSQ